MRPELFDLVWGVLKTAGYCDPIGSNQYHSIRVAWTDAGEPDDISQFIANFVGYRR